MSKVSEDKKDIRRTHNDQLIKRMRDGESLWSYDSKASWFPPRPKIEKDPVAISKLYSNPKVQESYSDPTVRHIQGRLNIVSSRNVKNDTSEESTPQKVV
jgi:hypothetical protein